MLADRPPSCQIFYSSEITDDMFKKYASFDSQILDFRSAPNRTRYASLDKFSEFDKFRSSESFMYVRCRAISSRINLNHDSWPSVELAGSSKILDQHRASSTTGFTVNATKGAKYGFSTFLGKPIFVDHNNSDPSRARGVIVDSKLHVEDFKTASLDPFYSSPEAETYHLPPTWVELLLEVDAHSFPKFAKAIIEGAEDPNAGINGFSMGASVTSTECNICHNIAHDENDFCLHVLSKGMPYKALDSKTGKIVQKKAAEACRQVSYFELSGVFSPADETALTKGLVYAKMNKSSAFIKDAMGMEGMPSGYDNWLEAPSTMPQAGDQGWCPSCGGAMQPHASSGQSICPNCGPSSAPSTTPKMPSGQQPLSPPLSSWNRKMKSNFRKHAPEPSHDKYFGGKPGAAKEAYEGMQKEYGDAKGEEVYFATLNKHKNSSLRLADGAPTPDNTPQYDLTTAPQSVNTLRKSVTCEICGSEVNGSSCQVCGWTKMPDSLDNPDLTKARENAKENLAPKDGPLAEGYEDPRQQALNGPRKTSPINPPMPDSIHQQLSQV